DDRALQAVFHAGEDLRGAQEGGDVQVMAAGVHDADRIPIVLAARPARPGQVDTFLHRQRVHVRTQCYDGPRQAASQDADDTRVGDVRADLDADAPKVLRDE